MNKDIKKAPGSLEDVSNAKNLAVEEILMDVKHIIVVDTSASMSSRDCSDNMSRHDMAEKQLIALQQDLPGGIAVLSGSDEVIFCPSGIPERQMSGTDFYTWIRFIKPFDGCGIKFYIISDGQDYNDMAVELAKKFETPIHCIYIGPELKGEEESDGVKYLKRISEASKGKYVETIKVGEFQEEFKALMEGNGS